MRNKLFRKLCNSVSILIKELDDRKVMHWKQTAVQVIYNLDNYSPTAKIFFFSSNNGGEYSWYDSSFLKHIHEISEGLSLKYRVVSIKGQELYIEFYV